MLDLRLPVLVGGEVGSGKRVVAALEALHTEEGVVLGLVDGECFKDLVDWQGDAYF